MSNKKTKTQPVEEPTVVEHVTPENGVIADEAPRTVVFEEALEAILFAAGHPISYATLARVFEMTPAKVRDKVFEYSLKYNAPEISRGVIMLVFNDSCQLCTKKYYLNEIREALGIRKSGTLSTSSMEVLAIVAYNQPVTRVFVDTLRRADSSYAMNNLLDRGLIESKGRLDAPGRPMLYGTTNDFLRCFGLKDLKELPQTTEEIQSMFANTSNVSEDAEAELEGGEQLSLEEAINDKADDVSVEATSDSESLTTENNEVDSDPSADEMIDNGDVSFADDEFDGDPSADEYIDFAEDEE